MRATARGSRPRAPSPPFRPFSPGPPAASFSAISSVFGGPLVAGMLLLEAGVGLGVAVIPFLIPGLVAASLGYLIFVGLGNWGGIEAAPLSVPGLPPYEGAHLRDLVVAVGA